MANRRPLVVVAGAQREIGADNLVFGNVTLNQDALTSPREIVVPDTAGTVALTSDISAGTTGHVWALANGFAGAF